MPMHPMSLLQGDVVIGSRDVLPPQYDICDDAQAIHLILRYMVMNFY